MVPRSPRTSAVLLVGRTASRAALCALLLFGALGTGCRSAGEEEPADAEERPAEELSFDKFRQLIAEGALRPVTAMETEDAFAGKEPEMEDDPFAKANEKFAKQTAKEQAQSGEPIEPKPAPTVAPPAPPIEQASENPYLVFGKRIQVYPSGLIMKPYPLRVGTGTKMLKLMQTFGNFALWAPGAEPQTADQVRLDLEEKWDLELFSDLRLGVPDDGKAIGVADWLIVTTGPALLEEVESFINIFAAGIPQIEIEAKIVEVTITDALDLGIRPVSLTTPIFGFPDGTFVDSFSYNLPNTSGALNTLLTIGSVQDGTAINAVIQALAVYENVSIISRPKIAVREGGKAEILNTLKIPNLNVTGISPDGKFGAAVQYEEVGIKLFVIPRVVGTQTVALNIDIEASAQSGSSVTFTLGNNQQISNPIISRRAAKTVVYLEPGQAVILGGLITERTVDVENKVPLLGDIPILGYLFKSKLKRKEQTNVLFFIRPRILQGSDVNREF